ncbi:MAG: carboxypeptidase-like regulatory domain-containing protein [Bryobacteraceae bacterium]
MKTKTHFVSAILILLAVAGVLLAQDKKLNEDPNTRSVEGIVTDAGGKPVQAAVVQLKDSKTLQIRSFYTTQEGAYHFSGLNTNVDYELKADHNGSSSGVKNLSNFDSRKTATVNLKIK